MLDTKVIPITINPTKYSRIKEVDFKDLPFGKYFSDHMFVIDYKNDQWQEGVIMPYGPLSMAPSISALHYGQAIFEGMKAFKDLQGNPYLFRPTDNINRFNISADRMCMPNIPEEIFMAGLTELIRLDKGWIPEYEGASLYIRPVMFAIDEYVGVKASKDYRFVIFTCPVGKYYSEPVSILVESKFVRACEGGVGLAKAAGNYGATLMPAKKGQDKGYQQLLWLDAYYHKFIEESGTMNVMFVIGDTVVTPSLTGTILNGFTRDSSIQIFRDWGVTVTERRISIDELVAAHEKNMLRETFGVGTAATIAHVKRIGYNGKDILLPEINPEMLSVRLLKTLNLLRSCQIEDKFGWMYKV